MQTCTTHSFLPQSKCSSSLELNSELHFPLSVSIHVYAHARPCKATDELPYNRREDSNQTTIIKSQFVNNNVPNENALECQEMVSNLIRPYSFALYAKAF